MKRITAFFCLLALASMWVSAQTIKVKLKPDASFSNTKIVCTMENNLSSLLTEINAAQREGRPLNLEGQSMNDFSKRGLAMLWANIDFFCDEDYVVDRLWNFSDGYMARQIPLMINPSGEDLWSSRFQEAVVEFDKQGRICDFRFAMDAAIGESMERGGDPVDIERRMQILAYCDRFRTAYNTKDINFLEQVFSEDALIITGTVVTSRKGESIRSSVKYKKQNKVEYLDNLRKSFEHNKWIEVKFSQIGDHGEGDGSQAVTRSTENPNIYGVRLHQEWHSSSYSDEGYVFLLWDFTDESHPVIHVRTWQPRYVGKDELSQDEILGLHDFRY